MITVSEQPFDPWQALQTHQASALLSGSFGATSVFVGSMRDFNQGDTVTSMTLEHYPGMTEKVLQGVVEEAAQQWRILDSLVVHRVGEVFPEQPIVLVAVWSAHRGDACDACRHITEALKARVPFWKKEQLDAQTSRWVSHNSNGYASSSN